VTVAVIVLLDRTYSEKVLIPAGAIDGSFALLLYLWERQQGKADG